MPTEFENRPKSRIEHCERSELYLHFEWTLDKGELKMPKMSILASFWKPEACGQTVLPEDKKKMVENAKTEKL